MIFYFISVIVVQRVEDNCVNLLDSNGLLFCYGCSRTVGYRLEGGDGIVVLFNVRSNLHLPHRVNADGDRMVVLSSNYERREVFDLANELNVDIGQKCARGEFLAGEPPVELAKLDKNEVKNLIGMTQKRMREDISFGEPSTKRVKSVEIEGIRESDTVVGVSNVAIIHEDIILRPAMRPDNEMLIETISISDSEVDEAFIEDDGVSVISSENSRDFVSNYGGVSPALSIGRDEFNGVRLPDYDDISEAGSLDQERPYTPIDYYGERRDFDQFGDADAEIAQHLSNFHMYNRGSSVHAYLDDFDLSLLF